ncbi:MAG: tryptophan synthase subunit alpha [Planctomycetaceae bacterium]|jgi:tryptophan synthase alpha chain|nr:tryptophan synthase subunit alpha [Planctomycetaceae bacterium]
MPRLQKTFERTRAAKRPALVGYLTAGDPDFVGSLDIIDAACSAGLDILEIGIPFSDPTADGPVIQRASSRAIKAGMNLEKGISYVQSLRQKHPQLPIIIFSYYNPIFAMGTDRFVKTASDAGADGVLVVDLPGECSDEITRHVKQGSFHFIRLVSPTTAPKRREEILKNADGFVYVVSRHGVTGSGGNSINWNALQQEITEMKMITEIPLCVGFGISTPEDVKNVANIADGVVVGSAFQRLVEDEPKTAKGTVAELVRKLRG